MSRSIYCSEATDGVAQKNHAIAKGSEGEVVKFHAHPSAMVCPNGESLPKYPTGYGQNKGEVFPESSCWQISPS